MKNKKESAFVFALIIIVVVIASSAITWFIATKKLSTNQIVSSLLTTPTLPINSETGWQVYTNNKFFYSIEIPQGFSAEESGSTTDKNDSVDHLKRDVFFEGSYNSDNVIINVHIGTTALGDGKCSQNDYIDTIKISDQNIEVCKGDGLRFDFAAPILLRDMFIEISGDKDKTSQTQELFEKIIASIKFTA